MENMQYLINDPDVAVAYVDGSYDADTKRYAGSIVMLYNGEQKNFSFVGSNETLASMRNVAGEIRAAEKAMEIATFSGATKLVLCYDYIGIENWAMEKWKAGKEGTIRYKERYDLFSQLIDIEFVKIKAHSGDKYNEIADKLARDALFGTAS